MRTQKPADSEATTNEKEYNKSDRESRWEGGSEGERASERARVEEQARDGRRGEGNELC